jgi:hypothetical protein
MSTIYGTHGDVGAYFLGIWEREKEPFIRTAPGDIPLLNS